jgi:hypothetical protein
MHAGELRITLFGLNLLPVQMTLLISSKDLASPLGLEGWSDEGVRSSIKGAAGAPGANAATPAHRVARPGMMRHRARGEDSLERDIHLRHGGGMGRALLRGALVFYALVLLLFAAGFFYREWWATDLWPFSYTAGMSFAFVASILAAASASILYCALARDYRAMVGVGLDALVLTAPLAVMSFTSGRASMRTFGILAALTATAGLIALVWFHRYSWRDGRPTPRAVRIAFVIFVLALWATGGALVAGDLRVLPWHVSPEVARVYGFIFLGASSYFLYGLIIPKWSNAAGQLLGFLAYDVVLLVPFAIYFKHVPPERLVNHIVYTAVVVGSGVLAVLYCFVHPRTRLFGRGW